MTGFFGTLFDSLPGSIASSTAANIGVFAPLFELMGGIILAVFLVSVVIGFFSRPGSPQAGTGEHMDFNDMIPDDI